MFFSIGFHSSHRIYILHYLWGFREMGHGCPRFLGSRVEKPFLNPVTSGDQPACLLMERIIITIRQLGYLGFVFIKSFFFFHRMNLKKTVDKWPFGIYLVLWDFIPQEDMLMDPSRSLVPKLSGIWLSLLVDGLYETISFFFIYFDALSWYMTSFFSVGPSLRESASF